MTEIAQCSALLGEEHVDEHRDEQADQTPMIRNEPHAGQVALGGVAVERHAGEGRRARRRRSGDRRAGVDAGRSRTATDPSAPRTPRTAPGRSRRAWRGCRSRRTARSRAAPAPPPRSAASGRSACRSPGSAPEIGDQAGDGGAARHEAEHLLHVCPEADIDLGSAGAGRRLSAAQIVSLWSRGHLFTPCSRGATAPFSRFLI